MTLQTLVAWLVGAGGVAAVVALLALNPLAAARFFSAVAGLVMDKARALAEWSRDPRRNWWKIGCVSLACTCALLSWYADSQRQAVIATETHWQDIVVKMDGEQKQVRDTATANFNALMQCQGLLELEVGFRQETERLNAEAVADAQADADKAKADLAEWKRRPRPANCTAALAALEASCPSLSDF